MIQALLYLHFLTLWNRLRSQVRRLKRPKYLAGFLVGGLYFYFYFIRPVVLGGSRANRAARAIPPEWFEGLETIGAVILAVVVLAAWLFPHSRAALTFTEAEVAFLFPAPIRRRTLIHFKLLRSQAGIFVTTLIMALLSNRIQSKGGAWISLAGWWLILSTLNLHFMGASFARARLAEWGVNTWKRRGLILVLLAALGGTAWWWSQGQGQAGPTTGNPGDVKEWVRSAKAILASQPIAACLAPFRLVVKPYLATSAVEFLQLAWPVLLLLVAHYGWVIRSDVAFEEGSLDLARQRAERLAAMRREPGKAGPGRPRRAPFTLSPVGPPSTALLWKNLIGAGALLTGRRWLLLALAFTVPALVIGLNSRREEFSVVACLMLGMGLVWTTLLGPQLLRLDLRQDLASADMLKLYPLPGWKIILGEMLAPTVILSVIQWAMLGLLVVLFSGIPGIRAIPLHERVSVGFAAALLSPALNVVSLLVPNGAVLMFPAWLQAGPGGPQGIEATGQRLIFLLGQLLVFALALLPAVAVGTGMFFLLTLWMPWPVVMPMAGLGACLVLAGEAGAGVMALGKLFERLDVAAELRS